MATITYQDVPSAEGGNIFRDKKFWVSHRVPMRSNVVQMIKENGGTEVMREKDADMIIIDHLKKIEPTGYSWKFITESVMNGFMQVEDKYFYDHETPVVRPAGGGGPGKGTRTPFTKMEDALLARWVLDHPQGRTGNKIFQEFEQTHPSHTWQSWRNRYVKTLNPLPMEKLFQLAASASLEIADVRTNGNTQADPDPRPTRTPLPTSKPNRAEATEQRIEPPTTIPDQPDEETRQQEEPEEMEETRETRGDDDSSHEEPRENGVPAEDEAQEETTIEAQTQEPPQQSNPTEGDRASHAIVVPDAQEIEDPEDELRKQEFYADLYEFVIQRHVDIKRRPKIHGRLIELWDLNQAVDVQEVPYDDVDWEFVAEDLGYGNESHAAAPLLEECYRDNLKEFLDEVMDFDINRDEQSAADERDLGHEEIAEEEVEEETVVGVIQSETTDFHATTQRNNSRSPGSYVPSSPPLGFLGKKRPLPNRFPSSSGPSTKRRRFSRNAEIPSTPEEKIGVIRDYPSTQKGSPSFRRNLIKGDYVDMSEASQHLPPLPAPLDEEEEEEDDDDVEMQNGEHDGEEQVQEEDVAVNGDEEEETQTLRAEPPPETQVDVDITPSQQLRSELNPSPIPLNLEAARSKHSKSPSQNTRHSEPTTTPDKTATTTTAAATKAPILTSRKRRTLPSSFSTSQQQQQQQPSSSTNPQTQPSPPPARDIAFWIAHYRTLGFPRATILDALFATTLTPGTLAQHVMQTLHAGKGLPSHHEGVWTPRDDADLQALDAKTDDPAERKRLRKVRARLVNKHGAQRVELRRAFLKAQAGPAGEQLGR